MSIDTDAFPALNKNNHDAALYDGIKSATYAQLYEQIEQFAGSLLLSKVDLAEERIAIYIPASIDYVAALFGVWRAGGIAVPLNVTSALPELEHALKCAGVTQLVTHTTLEQQIAQLCAKLGIKIRTLENSANNMQVQLPEVSMGRRAMILFTSGTTNKPKGVVTTHKNIHAQITMLVNAWQWQAGDSIPLFLPLHHVHGIINILACALWAGATVHLEAGFNLSKIMREVAKNRYSVFMAVPTIYVKIIEFLNNIDTPKAKDICASFKKMRLNVSGSSACPVSVYKEWLRFTGQTLLERYGMTEIGMAISNPYEGERRAGAVGLALPGVELALFDEAGHILLEEGLPGEIRVKGDGVFLEYWNNTEATENSFSDGWFVTGDMAILEAGYYRILGRTSIDIIKSGGYKLSALEIESVLLTHDSIVECAVVAQEDDTWGEIVMAFLVLAPGTKLSYEQLKNWCIDKMSAYKIPKKSKVLDSLPRNAMGKVMKPALKEMNEQTLNSRH